MDWVPNDWLVFMVRWVHVIAGIMWIGNSFYFMWLDANLEAPNGQDPLSEGSLWMVHSGGFYQVERRKIGPGSMPPLLHWFKWEATFTWISGIFLLGLVYYAGKALLLLNANLPAISPAAGVGLSIFLLILAWVVYDLFYQSPLARISWLAHGVAAALVAGTAYLLCHIFSGRGAFIQMGAMFGTIMVLNVWIRILPGQKRMIAATARGEMPDFEQGKRAKRRSVHNSYLTLPVLFMMISNHAPQAYGQVYNWVVLLLLIVGGMLARHLMILQTRSKPWLWVLAPLALTALAMAWVVTRPAASLSGYTQKPANSAMGVGKARSDLDPITDTIADTIADDGFVEFSEIRAIIHTRCVPCHAREPADATFGPLPGGVSFESDPDIYRLATRIRFRAVETTTMPVGNKTQMTDAERHLLGRWIDQGQVQDEDGYEHAE